MDELIVPLAFLISIGLALIAIATKGSKTRRLEENRRAAQRHDRL